MRLSKNKLLGAGPTCWRLGGSESGPRPEHKALWQLLLLLNGVWLLLAGPIRDSDLPGWWEAGCPKGQVLTKVRGQN